MTKLIIDCSGVTDEVAIGVYNEVIQTLKKYKRGSGIPITEYINIAVKERKKNNIIR